jgi:hypothetical protein
VEIQSAPGDQPLSEIDREAEEHEESAFRKINLVGR